MRGWLACLWRISLALALSGCGANSTADTQVDLLDPSQPQYGKTYAEWAAEWATYTYRVAPPECANPFVDESGKDCQMYQDPESPVFFLVGVFGGVARRSACPVPKGKALFFPIVNSMADNVGVSPDSVKSETALSNHVRHGAEATDANQMRLSVDGHSISHLERGLVRTARYEVSLMANANVFACSGVEGIEGDFPGYVAGHWALLPPLSSGEHSIEFGARIKNDPSNPTPFVIDVEYTFNL